MKSILRVASEQVTSEILDGEVMIVNLESGSYYNMTGAGTDIWQCLQAGADREQILEFLSKNYDASAEEIDSTVTKVLDQLLEENLIAVFEPTTAGKGIEKIVSTAASRSFSEPTLSKYTDMQELLLLDPIHDVDAAGWPLAKDNSDN